MSTIVYLNGTDNISKYVITVPSIVEGAGDYGQLTVSEIPNIIGDNRNGFWDITAPQSPFYNVSVLSNFSVDIENNGTNVFSGVIRRIITDNNAKTSTVELVSNIKRSLEKGIIYASARQDTPANMIAEICDLYKINYDSSSIGRSNTEYYANNIYCSAFFDGKTTVLDAIQQIAQIGVARAYIYNQKMHFDVYRSKSVSAVFTASDQVNNTYGITLWTHPSSENVEKEPIEGYRIEYVNGEGPLAATLGTQEQQTFSLNAGNSANVRIMTLQSAVWLGELWRAYFNTPQQIVTCRIPAQFGKSLGINYPVDVEYRNRATQTIDLTSVDNNSKLYTELKGLTR